MTEKYSLIDLMENDFCFESLKAAKKQTKESKVEIDKTAAEYSTKYSQRIDEGTRKRTLMLEQAGIEDGTLAAEEYFKDSNTFMPTVHTPILNMLFFLTEEFGEQVTDTRELKKMYDEKFGGMLHEDVDTSVLKNNMAVKLEQMSQGSERLTDDFDTGETVPHMEKYIYQNMDAGTFGKLKKLKQLSKSDNEQEAKMAWIKCMDICEKFGLDIEDIPCKY